MKKRIIVAGVVNENNYKSKVEQIIKGEEVEQIALCKRHIRTILDEDGLYDVSPEYIIEN